VVDSLSSKVVENNGYVGWASILGMGSPAKPCFVRYFIGITPGPQIKPGVRAINPNPNDPLSPPSAA
jgi:hypothetical protein